MLKDALQQLIHSQVALYREQPDRMVSDFNREQELIGEYNGRQLLEMLQNADDEEARSVQIELDEKRGRLIISNQGIPFTEKGFRSLMISNLSAKRKGRYIGNKGLGFRSIVNWANKIAIQSAGLLVTFSEEIVATVFEDICPPETQAQIRLDQGLAPDAVPLAFLAVPRVAEAAPVGWATQIAIMYQPAFLDDIKAQLAALQPECLLFLNHIHHIEIHAGGLSRILSREVRGNQVTIDAEQWTIHEVGADLPDHLQDRIKDGRERYSLKLALAPGLCKGGDRLYTFFPTKVDFSFPMVVHGTFDLDSSRNQLIKSAKNKFILERLVELILSTAQAVRDKGDRWLQVRLLRYETTNVVLNELGFYEHIDKALREMEIFPCVDGNYRRLGDIYYLGDEFSRLVSASGTAVYFPGLVCLGLENAYFYTKYRSVEKVAGFRESINELSARLPSDDIGSRVTLIAILAQHAKHARYALLVNEQGGLIADDCTAFTPLTSGMPTFAVPAFVKIDFMNRKLFDSIVVRLGITGEKAREVQRVLAAITNLQSYEPAQVIRRIVSATKAAIAMPRAPIRTYIGEMVSALLANYMASDLAPLQRDSIPLLLNGDLEVCDARELVLSAAYPDGVYADRLLAKVYGPRRFLAAPAQFSPHLDGEDPGLLQNFFLWLGVRRFVRYEEVSGNASADYEGFVFDAVERPPGYRRGQVNILAIPEGDLTAMISALTKEELVEWLMRDQQARVRLEPNNPDMFRYSTANTGANFHYTLLRKPAHLLFQLRRRCLFDDYLIHDDDAIAFVNETPFDFDASGFDGVARREIETVLVRLGAKDRIDQLSLDRVAKILRSLPQHDPSGRSVQKVYRMALAHYERNGQRLPADVPLFARRGKEAGYYRQGEVYYSENNRLPKKIADRFALLSYPRRSGGAKVPAFFGVKNVIEIGIAVEHKESLPALTMEYEAWMRERLPYLLAYRIFGLHGGQRNEAKSLVRLSIEFCSELTCRVAGESVSLSPNEYVSVGGKHLVRVSPDQSLASLREHSAFCDTFADIVASVFDVNEHWADYRSVFKDGLSDVHHVAVTQMDEATLSEARQLLGMADPQRAFLVALATAAAAERDEAADAEDVEVLLHARGIDLSELDLERLSSPGNIAVLAKILEMLQLPVAAFNRVAFYKLELGPYHLEKLKQTRFAEFSRFRQAAWDRLRGLDWTARAQFLNWLAEYEHAQSWMEQAAAACNHVFEANYDAFLAKFVGVTFDGLVLGEQREFDTPYDSQRLQLSRGIFDELPATQKSWLYFEEGLEKVLAWIIDSSDKSPAQDEADSTIPPAEVTPAGAVATDPPSRSGPARTQPFKHTVSMENRNKVSGQQAERLVYESLVAAHGRDFVEHVSLDNDALGYDIRYSSDRGTNWKCAEVKHYSRNCIFLSENERRFAAENCASYELFLVTPDDRIHVVPSANFDDADSFTMVADGYTAHFVLVSENL